MPFYRTDVPDTASELFDGELVIAHYGSGLYYSLSETGALVWQGLRHGLSVDEVADWLGQHFVAAGNVVAEEVRAVIDRLVEEALVVEVEASVNVGPLPTLADAAWSTPALERFDDLQELLLLDPVHDVSDAGWPHRPDDQS